MKLSEKNIVFVLDEVHDLIDLCRGYSFHRSTANNLSGEESLKFWYEEQSNKMPHPDKKHCTDLFYQLRHIMLISLSNQNLFGFVMCSTEYRTWEHFEVENSPFSREKNVLQ
ncbi:uncharacterized protein LOC136096435 [Hydra vulgaris]|uniref:uncharacterized protein LOC124813401 n=1 Tax=Hydra vulgaris TaxID=6087 RepID=UPI001F5FE555|nr:uncharacterized protein LOC124813401 [Hydra vulgaris]